MVSPEETKNLIAARPWIVAVALLAAVALWMASGALFSPEEKADPLAPVKQDATETPSVQVRTQQAQLITRYEEVYGRTKPARIVEIAAETDGRVVAVPVPRGARVRSGRTLIELDERDRLARIDEAKAQVKQFDAQFNAQKELFDEGGYVSETDLAATEASLERARAELKRAEIDVSNMTIRAPFSGSLDERMVEIGDYVRVGDPVARVVDDLTIVVEASVPERTAGHIEVGDQASAELVTGQTVDGKIRFVSPVADPATRTFQVELEVNNRMGDLPAGVTAALKISLGEVYAQHVASSLLTLDESGTVGVKIVDDLGRVEFYPADIAATDDNGVWIVGLPESSDVILVGHHYVRPGDQVDSVFMKPGTAFAQDEIDP